MSDDPYNEGYYSFPKVQLNECPYPHCSYGYFEWRDGWKDARDDAFEGSDEFWDQAPYLEEGEDEND